MMTREESSLASELLPAPIDTLWPRGTDAAIAAAAADAIPKLLPK